MGLFRFFSKSDKVKFHITEADREWVEENFSWLTKTFGHPYRQNKQVLLTKEFFPNALGTNEFSVDGVIGDFCQLLQIGRDSVKFNVIEDLRDAYSMPIEIKDGISETELDITDDGYTIHISSSVCKQPQRLVYYLTKDFTRIKLIDGRLDFQNGEDSDFFIYLAGVYFGFGVLLSKGMRDIGRADDSVWETTWAYTSNMPYEVMAYGLALHTSIAEHASLILKEELPNELKQLYEAANEYLQQNPSKLFEPNELGANNLFHKATVQYEDNHFEDAIESLFKATELTHLDSLMAEAYNNIGYNLLRLGRYAESIEFFQKCLEIDDSYGIAYDNMGYVCVKLGEHEQGREWMEKAIATENNDLAYSSRNFAIYYDAIGDVKMAEIKFNEALRSKTLVDILELSYAEFLLKHGRLDEGMKYLKIAVSKGEPEAIRLYDELDKPY